MRHYFLLAPLILFSLGASAAPEPVSLQCKDLSLTFVTMRTFVDPDPSAPYEFGYKTPYEEQRVTVRAKTRAGRSLLGVSSRSQTLNLFHGLVCGYCSQEIGVPPGSPLNGLSPDADTAPWNSFSNARYDSLSSSVFDLGNGRKYDFYRCEVVRSGEEGR